MFNSYRYLYFLLTQGVHVQFLSEHVFLLTQGLKSSLLTQSVNTFPHILLLTQGVNTFFHILLLIQGVNTFSHVHSAHTGCE